jgi:hypothetical protein
MGRIGRNGSKEYVHPPTGSLTNQRSPAVYLTSRNRGMRFLNVTRCKARRGYRLLALP